MKKILTTINSIPGPVFIATAATLWGLDGLLRGSLYSLPAVVIVFYEALLGSLLITPFVLRPLFKTTFSRKDWILLVIVALLSGLLGTLFFTEGLVRVQFIPISIVFLMQKLQPVFATSTAVILLKEKIQEAFILWAGVAIVAAYFVTFPGGVVNLSTGSQTALAGALGLGAAFCWGSATAFSRKLLLKHSVRVVTSMRFYLTSFFALAAIPLLTKVNSIPTVSTPQLMALITIALSTGMVALVLYYQGLQKTQAKISTIVELIFPMIGILIDANKKTILGWFGVSGEFITNSILSPSQLVAAGILVFAVYQVAQLNSEK